MKDGSIDVSDFDFAEPAELYGGSSWSKRRITMAYRKFGTAAEAIRYVMEELPESSSKALVLEVGETRLNHAAIRKLYECDGYPLQRAT